MGRLKRFKWIVTLAGAVAAVLLLRGFAFTSCLIPSEGMENSLFEGERIIVNKWSYGLRTPLMSVFPYRRWRERPVKSGDIVIFNNPKAVGQPVIDRREMFISRCAGTPGDTLMVDSLYNVLSPEERFNPDKKRPYIYPASKERAVTALLSKLSIDNEGPEPSGDTAHIRSFSRYEYYLLKQTTDSLWIRPLVQEEAGSVRPLVVPGKGRVIRVYPWNRALLRDALEAHEGRRAEIKNDTLYVDGKPTQHCIFSKNYYWMSSNNALNFSDSRSFGFVPQDHLIGKATLVWFSKKPGTGPFSGYRWERFFHWVE